MPITARRRVRTGLCGSVALALPVMLPAGCQVVPINSAAGAVFSTKKFKLGAHNYTSFGPETPENQGFEIF